ncbi:hypothetical protein DOM22_03325 [Bdellovibrio sp. ZAP7]|uniref:hypothetical protein n=1 Tax=Bdellovibrio sp. ZAP7 TaxID=2231053 RepID=UPI00115A07C2|nr:hypothetical protein [Bdellovibrio sp. ZAP7]QDK44253.1 hypothetical protein DOM22_03325 [Bdellovibrio sp. ZAP7]
MQTERQILVRELIWTFVLVIFNPFNLIALYSHYTGKRFLGVEHAQSGDVMKAYVLPTLIYAIVWLILKKWKRWSYWNLYFFSFLGAIAIYFVLFTYFMK